MWGSSQIHINTGGRKGTYIESLEKCIVIRRFWKIGGICLIISEVAAEKNAAPAACS